MVDEYSRLSAICEEISRIEGVSPTLYSDNYSDLYFLEVFSSRATKARGMQMIKELTGASKVVAFGDNLNDIEMLKTADIGIAVGAGTDIAMDAADIVLMKSGLTDAAAAFRLSAVTVAIAEPVPAAVA